MQISLTRMVTMWSTNTSQCSVQECINSLLQQYVHQLILTERDDLVPLYCCHMRMDKRRETNAHYFYSLNKRVEAGQIAPVACQQAYHAANAWFTRWHKGDIAAQELDVVTKQVRQH